MGRMSVGRFPDRAAALDFLVEKYSTKDTPAKYNILEKGVSRVSLFFDRDFGNGRFGEVGYVGNGADLTSAIEDLFKQLGDEAALTEET